MKIWHISDTHTNHSQLMVPDNIDLVIHSGDATNHSDPVRNEREMYSFLNWFSCLEIEHKIFVAGNHDTSIERGLITGNYINNLGIRYLFNESIIVNSFNIWGSPRTPTYGNWAFMKPRNTINRVWEFIPDNTDIVVTHGPPKGFLDITNRRDNLQEQCGCGALAKRITEIKPKLVCFGHIHNTKNIQNSGTKQVVNLPTMFSNGACTTDGLWGQITSHGNVIEL